MSKIDYDLTKIRAIASDVDGVLSPCVIPVDANGMPMRMANVRDGFAIQLAVRLGMPVAIITGGSSEAVRKRFEPLGVTDIYLRAARKLPILQEWMERNGLQPSEVAYLGDDLPDIEAMQAVGLSVAPADAAAEVKAIARYITPCLGGHGVARDVIEQILKAKGQWLTETACNW